MTGEWRVDPEIRGVRRALGFATAAGAALAAIVALVFSVQALVFQLSTAEAVGEIVAVAPVFDAAGEPRVDRQVVVVEYPDRNGQFRRFDQEVEGGPPEKGAEIVVRYRMGPPVEARVENGWWLWRPASIAGGVALLLALAAEEGLRNRRRPSSVRG